MSSPQSGSDAGLNFYTVGGPVQAGQGIYVPRSADKELLQLCREGIFAYILTSRQMGKSSLMVRTAEQLADEGVLSVVIDLQGVGKQVSAEQWYLNFLASLEEALEDQGVELEIQVRQWWKAQQDLGAAKRLSLFFEQVLLAEVSQPIVIFVDEIDTTLGLEFTDDFFVAIRYLYVSRAVKPSLQWLSFVLIGVATPGDLIRDAQRTPFNVGRRVELTDFSFEEALPLAAGLGLSQPEAERVLGWVLDWTGGHPYLTQQLCRAVVEASQSLGSGDQTVGGQVGTAQRRLSSGGAEKTQSVWTRDGVNRVVETTFLGEMSERDNNLQFVRDMLTRQAPDIYEVLTLYKEVRRGRSVEDEEQSLIKTHLKLSGVVKRLPDKSLQVRNAIYETVFDRQWIQENLPINWRKRIRRLQGAISASLLLLGVLSGLTAWTLRERARAESALAQVKIERDRAEQEAENARQATDQALIDKNRAEGAERKAEERLNEANIARVNESEQRLIAEKALKAEAEQRQRADQQAEQQRQIALARQLAAQSDSARQYRGNLLPRSILLAIESNKRLLNEDESIFRRDADQALRKYPLMAPEIARLTHDDDVRAVGV